MTQDQERRLKPLLKKLVMEVRQELKENLDFKDVWNKRINVRISNSLNRLNKTMSSLSTINDMKNSGLTPEQIDEFFIGVNKHLGEIEYLISSIEKQ